jgi:hypothetical protein
MLVAEIVIIGVFIAALLATVACFGYLMYATVLEHHLLRSRPRMRRATAGAESRLPAYGSPALPLGRH